LKKRGYETTLKEIAAIADPRQRTVEVTVQIENPDHLLKPGLFARMDIIFRRTTGAMVIPEACLLKGHGKPRIFVIRGDRAEIRAIETGIREAEMIEVLSGLTMDSKVVSAGKDQLSGGDRVNIQQRKAE
jgi:multidrug efflux pump subunit AcrA (membrane-fusion protein)